MPVLLNWQLWPLILLFLALLLNNRALLRAQGQLPTAGRAQMTANRTLLFVVQYLSPIAIATLVFAQKRWGTPAWVLAVSVLGATAVLGNGLVWRRMQGGVPPRFRRLQILSLLLMQALLGLVLFTLCPWTSG